MMDIQQILKTEYSDRFDEIRKNMMVVSYFKYGAMQENIANFAMIEFMYPSIPGAKYIPTDNGACEIAGFSINEIRNFKD